MSKVIEICGVNITMSEENLLAYMTQYNLSDFDVRQQNNVRTLYSMALTAADAMFPPSMMIDAVAIKCSGEVVVLSSQRKIPYIEIVADGFGYKVRERDNAVLTNFIYSDAFLADNRAYMAVICLKDVNANSGI